jgi:quercetin dioxygenase-like cupin family protein
MSLYNWSAIPLEQLGPLFSRQVIHTSRLTIAKLVLKKGAVVPLHHHENEQVTTMQSGALRFEIAGESVIVRGGESLCIPPNAPHRVEALEDSLATDVFTPPREDWIRGDDAYLRDQSTR